jgi:hypothetical protein
MSDFTLLTLVKRLAAEERQALLAEAHSDVAESERRLQDMTAIAQAHRGHLAVLSATISRVATDEQQAAAENVVNFEAKMREKVDQLTTALSDADESDDPTPAP